MDSKSLFEAVKIALTVLAAGWVYFKFVRERTHARRVAFSIECNFFGPLHGKFVAEFILRIKNQGLVIHRFNKLRLRVRGINKEKELEPWSRQQSRLSFPEKLIDEDDVIFSAKYASIFVEPGVEQTVTFVAAIPEQMSLILVRAEFEYSDSQKHRHSTERVFAPLPKADKT